MRIFRTSEDAKASPWENFVTKDQLLKLLEAWGVKEPIPGRGQQLVVAFPAGSQYAFAMVRGAGQKSTYGKPMWRVTLTNDPNVRVRMATHEEADKWPSNYADARGTRWCERCGGDAGVRSNREWLTSDQTCDRCGAKSRPAV